MRERDTDFLLGENAEERDGSFLCIPAIRAAGASGSRGEFNIVIGIDGRRHIVKQGVPLERVRIVRLVW